jgi:hypothetical protein
VLRRPLGRRLSPLFHRTPVYTPTATVAGLDRSDATRRVRWWAVVLPAVAGMLLAFAATTLLLGADDDAPSRVASTQAATVPSDVATLERLVQDELQLSLDDPETPGVPLTVTSVSCTPPVRGKARCAARFLDQGGRPDVKIAVSFPRGRMVWRVVR